MLYCIKHFLVDLQVLYLTLIAASWQEYAAAGTVKQNYVNILLMLLRLRQACDHPLLVRGFNSNSQMASSIEMAKKLPREKHIFLLSCLEASLAICGICSVRNISIISFLLLLLLLYFSSFCNIGCVFSLSDCRDPCFPVCYSWYSWNIVSNCLCLALFIRLWANGSKLLMLRSWFVFQDACHLLEHFSPACIVLKIMRIRIWTFLL